MLEQLLATDKPLFITIRDCSFMINGQAHDHLAVQIQDIAAVRKFFSNGRLDCYSNDNRMGKDGQFCALCSYRYQCQQRIRLMLLVFRKKQPEPAILELTRSSFPALQAIIDEHGRHQLRTVLLYLRVVLLDNDRRSIEFEQS
jgi:hypothetical protein